MGLRVSATKSWRAGFVWLMPWVIIVHASLLGWMRPRTMDLNQKNSGRVELEWVNGWKPGEGVDLQHRFLARLLYHRCIYIARLSSSFVKSNKKSLWSTICKLADQADFEGFILALTELIRSKWWSVWCLELDRYQSLSSVSGDQFTSRI